MAAKKNQIRAIKSLESFEGLKPGDLFLLVSTQFKVANRAVFIGPKTYPEQEHQGGYFNWTDYPNQEPFHIWNFELNRGTFVFPYIF